MRTVSWSIEDRAVDTTGSSRRSSRGIPSYSLIVRNIWSSPFFRYASDSSTRLQSSGVDIADPPFLGGVVHSLVVRVVVPDPEVALEIVGVDHLGLVPHGAGDERTGGITPHVGDATRNATAALNGPGDPMPSVRVHAGGRTMRHEARPQWDDRTVSASGRNRSVVPWNYPADA